MAQYTTQSTVWDSIEANLLSALDLIKQTGGYNFDIHEIVTWGFDDFPFSGRWPAAGLVIGREITEDTFATTVRRCRRDIGIEMWVQGPSGPKRKEATFSRVYQMIISDIEKALLIDHTRGGYAEDTEISERSPAVDSQKKLIGAVVRAQVIYRHKFGDLYTLL